METNKRLSQIIINLEAKTKDMNPSEFRFYNIAHFPIIAQKTLEYSQNCSICRNNMATIENLIELLPDSITREAKIRKHFETEKNNLEKHLQKKHDCHFPGYYAALGSLIGLIAGILFAIVHWLSTNQTPFNKLTLIALAVFLITARGIGSIADKNIFKEKLQL